MLKFRGVGLTYTLTCPLACRDCMVESSPKAQGKMDPLVARGYIDAISRHCDVVGFTGGEPMLYYNEILPLIRHAKSLGMGVTMVTGAGWVRTGKEEIARERVRGLKEAGLDILFISWDAYHEEWCAPEQPLLLIKLAQEAGLPFEVRGVLPATGAAPQIEQKLTQIGVPYETRTVVRLGAAAHLPDSHFEMSPDPEPGRCLVVTLPSIDPSGWVYTCCGPSHNAARSSPLVLGNAFDESLDSILGRAENDPILEAIHMVGPYALFQLLRKDARVGDLVPVRERYTSMCETCLDINHLPEVVARLRERLTDMDVRAMMMAARLYHKAIPEVQTSYANTM